MTTRMGKTALAVSTTALLVGAVAAPALAAGPTVSDGGFETPVISGQYQNYATNSTFGGWTVAAGDVDVVSSSLYDANSGQQSLDLNGGNPGTLTQSIPTTAGHTYTVSFAYAGNPDKNPDNGVPTPQTKSGTVAFGSSSRVLSFDTTNRSARDMGWTQGTLTGVTATSASTTLTLTSTTPGFAGLAFDDITVTDTTSAPASLPEVATPALLAIVGLSVVGVTIAIRRRATSD